MGNPKKTLVVRSKKGAIYKAVSIKGNIRVTTARTAPGQIIVVGVFDCDTKEWVKDLLPIEVKEQVEAAFA